MRSLRGMGALKRQSQSAERHRVHGSKGLEKPLLLPGRRWEMSMTSWKRALSSSKSNPYAWVWLCVLALSATVHSSCAELCHPGVSREARALCAGLTGLEWRTTGEDVPILFKRPLVSAVSSGSVVTIRPGYWSGINSVRYACLRQKRFDEEYWSVISLVTNGESIFQFRKCVWYK